MCPSIPEKQRIQPVDLSMANLSLPIPGFIAHQCESQQASYEGGRPAVSAAAQSS